MSERDKSKLGWIFRGKNPDTGRSYFRWGKKEPRKPKTTIPATVPPTFVAMTAEAVEKKEENLQDVGAQPASAGNAPDEKPEPST